MYIFTLHIQAIFKAAPLDAQTIKNEKIKIKLTVNTGQVMFSGKIFYY